MFYGDIVDGLLVLAADCDGVDIEKGASRTLHQKKSPFPAAPPRDFKQPLGCPSFFSSSEVHLERLATTHTCWNFLLSWHSRWKEGPVDVCVTATPDWNGTAYERRGPELLLHRYRGVAAATSGADVGDAGQAFLQIVRGSTWILKIAQDAKVAAARHPCSAKRGSATYLMSRMGSMFVFVKTFKVGVGIDASFHDISCSPTLSPLIFGALLNHRIVGRAWPVHPNLNLLSAWQLFDKPADGTI